MLHNNISFWELLECVDNDFENNSENNTRKSEHNTEELQDWNSE